MIEFYGIIVFFLFLPRIFAMFDLYILGLTPPLRCELAPIDITDDYMWIAINKKSTENMNNWITRDPEKIGMICEYTINEDKGMKCRRGTLY